MTQQLVFTLISMWMLLPGALSAPVTKLALDTIHRKTVDHPNTVHSNIILASKQQTIHSQSHGVSSQLIHRVMQTLNTKSLRTQRVEELRLRRKRWDAGLIALSMYNRSPESHRGGDKPSEQVALYDPFGGGVWGRKKRSTEDYYDFDYDGENL